MARMAPTAVSARPRRCRSGRGGWTAVSMIGFRQQRLCDRADLSIEARLAACTCRGSGCRASSRANRSAPHRPGTRPCPPARRDVRRSEQVMLVEVLPAAGAACGRGNICPSWPRRSAGEAIRATTRRDVGRERGRDRRRTAPKWAMSAIVADSVMAPRPTGLMS